MLKKSFLSVAIASSLALVGCSDGGITDGDSGLSAYPVFNPIASVLPVPNDLIFDSVARDGTFRVTNSAPPVTSALNELSGASTSAPIDIRMEGFVDEDSLDARPILFTGSSFVPNPNQNVFLLELDYASGDPVQGLSNQEVPTIYDAVVFGAAGGDPSALAAYGAINGLGSGVQDAAVAELTDRYQNPRFDVEVKRLDGTDYIRINLNKPLNPRKRYVVVLTNEIRDADGSRIQQDPVYNNLTDTSQVLLSSALAPVRSIINGLWETVGTGYFSALTNLGRTSSPLTANNIALSYSFTTSDDAKVLDYIAEPGKWITDRLIDLVKVGATKAAQTAALGDPDDPSDNVVLGYADYLTAVLTAYNTWLPSSLHPALAGCNAASAGAARFVCAGSNMKNALEAGTLGVTVNFPDPMGSATFLSDVTTTSPTFTSRSNALQVSALLSPILSTNPANVWIAQGEMTIPYYLGVPVGDNGTNLITKNWVADNVLATQLNAVFASAGLSIPQANPETSTAVNYLFPFPKKTADVTIPVLVMYPGTSAINGAPVDELTKTVIFQHGITTDRSAAMAFGSAMVATARGQGQNIAVVAIDHPLHGVGQSSAEDKSSLATRLLTAASLSTDYAGAVVARTFSTGLLQQLDVPCTALSGVDYADATSVGNAKLFIMGGGCDAEVGGAANGSTRMISATVLESTVANAGSAIPGLASTDFERHFDFKANATTGQPEPITSNVTTNTQESGSMFVNLTNFLGSRDNLRQHVLDLLELRRSLTAFDLNVDSTPDISNTEGVYFVGHSLGTVNGIPFVSVTNSTTSAADNIVASNMLTPGGQITRLYENSSTFGPRIQAGLAANGLTPVTSSYQAFLNVLQATMDAADPVNYVARFKPSSKVLFSEVLGDTFIPNNAYVPNPAVSGASSSALAGTDPLIVLSGATVIDDSTDGFTAPNAVKYTAGSHITPHYPFTGTDEESAVFAEMVAQATSIVLSEGDDITVTDGTVLADPDAE